MSGSAPTLEADAARALGALARRDFLRLAALAGAMGLLLPGCTRAPSGVVAPAGLRVLSPRSWVVLRAAALRIVGPAGAALIAAGAVDPALGADRFLTGAPALAAPLGQALGVLEFAIFPLLGKLRPFTALAGPHQDSVLEELASSRLALKRRLFGGIRAMALLGFYSSPSALPLVHYPLGTIADAMTWTE